MNDSNRIPKGGEYVLMGFGVLIGVTFASIPIVAILFSSVLIVVGVIITLKEV